MIIMKFGGTSVGSGERILGVAKIIKHFHKKGKVVVIVSAMQGTTDKLITIFNEYKSGLYKEAISHLQDLYEFHMLSLDDLRLPNPQHAKVQRALSDLFGLLSVYLKDHNQYLPKDYDYTVSFGERFSSVLLASSLNKSHAQAQAIDSAKIIVTTNEFNNARALIPQTTEKARKILSPLLQENKIPVITGFYGATKEGAVATLGRGGSDYSATILAHVLDANQVILWKEVDGVFSEDPKINKNAKYLPELTYVEALDLARKGAKILHPQAMLPVSSKAIPVWVKNTFNPKCIGTKIWKGVA